MYTQLADGFPQSTFLRVDVDKLQPIAQKYKVTAMPTFLAIKQGQVVDTVRLIIAPSPPLPLPMLAVPADLKYTLAYVRHTAERRRYAWAGAVDPSARRTEPSGRAVERHGRAGEVGRERGFQGGAVAGRNRRLLESNRSCRECEVEAPFPSFGSVMS